MANAVIVMTRVQSQNIDALNRTAQGTTDFQNGTPLALAFPTATGSDVFTATKAGAGATGVWLAYSPEVNKNIVGGVVGGLDGGTDGANGVGGASGTGGNTNCGIPDVVPTLIY